MKFGMSIEHAFGKFASKFDKNRMGNDVIVTSFNHSQSRPIFVNISISIEPTTFILCTNIQQPLVYLIVLEQSMTLADSEGQRWRSMITKKRTNSHIS